MTALLGVSIVLASLSLGSLWIKKSIPYDPKRASPPVVGLASVHTSSPPLEDYADVIPVINFHVVSTRPGPYTVTPARFAEEMAVLASAGVHTVRLAQIEALIRGERVPLPSKPVMLTFDDGPVSDYTTIDPILAEHGFTAVGFLITGQIVGPGRPSYYLNTDELKALARSGRWEFGGHTSAQHRNATILGDSDPKPALINRLRLPNGTEETLDQWRQRVRVDLSASQVFFRRILGYSATSFAFPFGASDGPTNDPAIPGQLDQLLKGAGYRIAFNAEDVEDAGPGSQAPAPVGVSAGASALRLPRFGAKAQTTSNEIIDGIRVMTRPPTPMNNLMKVEWTGYDATCQLDPGMGLRLRTSSYGTCVPQVNHKEWVNYRLEADITGVSPAATGIIAVRDGDTATNGNGGRIEVAIGESSFSVREQVGDLRRTLGEVPLDAQASSRHFVITVSGSRLTLQVDGLPLWAANIDPAIRAGNVTLAATVQGEGQEVALVKPKLSPL